MKAVLQRVKEASVETGGETVGEIGAGFLILLGVLSGDDASDAAVLASKISKLRVFEDGGGKMNLDCRTVGAEALVVSNFTLCADCRRGNRPDFFAAMEPAGAKTLYEAFIAALDGFSRIASGRFGADMKIRTVCDGPVTIILDSVELKLKKSVENEA